MTDTRAAFADLTEARDALAELAYLTRARAFVCEGWAPKVPDIGAKLALGRQAGENMTHATRLRARVLALTQALQSDALIGSGYAELMRLVDSAASAAEFHAAICDVTRRLVDAFDDYLARSHPIADHPTRRLIEGAKRDAAEQLRTLGALPASVDHRTRAFLESIEREWATRRSGDQIPFDVNLWRPLDRVARVARPASMRRGEQGALRVLPEDPFRTKRGIAIFLHNFLNEEITTMELACRNGYEHADMPWAFHVDVARHAGDEARHASVIIDALRQYGMEYGELPIYVSSYEGQYEFEPCERGSRRELLWRILLRQTFHEGLALDSLAFEVEKRKLLTQPDLVIVFQTLLADEIFHVQSGLRWSRFLCGESAEQAAQERRLAHDYFIARVQQTRGQFVARYPDEAIAEVERLDHLAPHHSLPIKRVMNVGGRRAAGFTDAELSQIVEWGYVEYGSAAEEDKADAAEATSRAKMNSFQ